jgi:PAS domain S-box-containing protein
MLRRAFDVANEVGDVTFAGYGCCNLISHLLAAGDPLGGVQREAEIGLDYARGFQYSFVVDLMIPQLQLIRMLRGLTPAFGHFNDADFDEKGFEQRLEPDPIASCWYWIRKLQGRFFAGAHASALDAASKAQPLLWTSTSSFEAAEYHYYAALARAALCDTASAEERVLHLEALTVHHRQLQVWVESCPTNFENRSVLVAAEIARVEGRALDAMNLYERAIYSSRENDFVHNEAIASELAARFYAERNFQMTAHTYLRAARHCYLRWGAGGKVQQLDAMYPHLQAEEPVAASTSTIEAPVERLDLATVIKVSQAVSGEIVLEKLLETLMRTAIEQAGAERGLLILSHEAGQRVAAEARTSNELVVVRLRDESVDAGVLPESVLHYALRTRESVILDDASAQAPFAADPYIRERQTRSVLCLPLLNQAKVIGVLFLENDLAPGVFVPARIAVLKLLASQAAISLENTRLYRDLAEREAKIRRLVDSNVIGIVIWDLDGRLIDANDAFLRMVRYEREDLNAGMRWFDMTPAEWQEAHVQEEAEELRTTGTMQAREKEFFRKDGSRVPVLIGAAAFEGQRRQGVAYILDLTDLKRAEAQARENEQRYREVQNELAHANRVATMGQLIGSIAHEVSQPIAATVIGTQAALHWLGRRPPELGELRQSLDDILSDSTRAGEIIGRIRDLIKKAPPRQDLLEINDPIQEVIELARGEAKNNSVTIKADLDQNLPIVRGDRVQIQQVMLNLIINALEAMSGDGNGSRGLLVGTRRAESGDVLVAVCDSGPGLAPGTEARIFEAFYSTKPAGLGMGLSICRSIVEAHRGRLWVSANEPRGLVFQFTLPPEEEIHARSVEGRP